MKRNGKKKEKDTRKEWLIGLLIGINLIILLPVAASIAMNPDMMIRQTQPSSEKPELSVDGEGNAHVHFISWIDEYGDRTYNVAYARINSQGQTTDGPEFVDDHPMNTYPIEPEKHIWDSAWNDHFFFTKFDSWDNFIFDDEYLKHTVIDGQGQVLIDNNTIASFPKHAGSGYGPSIHGIRLERRSDIIHIAWFVNTAYAGNYCEVYYMKINTDSDILVPPTRLYVYNGEPLIPYFLIFLGIPLGSLVAYYALSRRISTTDHSENAMRSPLTGKTKLAGLVLLVSVLIVALSFILFIAAPGFAVTLRTSESSTSYIPVGWAIILIIPAAFVSGFFIMILDEERRGYLWHQQMAKFGFASSLVAAITSFSILSYSISPGSSQADLICWLMVIFPIALLASTGLAAERSTRVLDGWRKEKNDETGEEHDGFAGIRADEE